MKKLIEKFLIIFTILVSVAVSVSASGYFNCSHKLKGTITKKEELVIKNEQSGIGSQLIIITGYVETYKSDGTLLSSVIIPNNVKVAPGNSKSYSTSYKSNVYRGRYSYGCKFDALTTVYSDSGYDY